MRESMRYWFSRYPFLILSVLIGSVPALLIDAVVVGPSRAATTLVTLVFAFFVVGAITRGIEYVGLRKLASFLFLFLFGGLSVTGLGLSLTRWGAIAAIGEPFLIGLVLLATVYVLLRVSSASDWFVVRPIDGFLDGLSVSRLLSGGVPKAEIGDERLTLRDLYRPDPYEFEYLVAEWLEGEGWDTEVQRASRDHGADILASQGTETILVEVKQKEGKVSSPVIQKARGALARFGASRAMVVNPGGFTDPAREEARVDETILIGAEELLAGLNGEDVEEAYRRKRRKEALGKFWTKLKRAFRKAR